ncbi:hypothetical protein RND71_018501 [Anisodus tanguticus]|uniref:Uncharacterized protein n=1 Tax=Anisodus tanguticus TaxID=243964 RepID=A0AAE1S4I8_9SOLA|nr:hypothetical protein RND71_018501 [Anisodus tanguticus]
MNSKNVYRFPKESLNVVDISHVNCFSCIRSVAEKRKSSPQNYSTWSTVGGRTITCRYSWWFSPYSSLYNEDFKSIAGLPLSTPTPTPQEEIGVQESGPNIGDNDENRVSSVVMNSRTVVETETEVILEQEVVNLQSSDDVKE